MEREVRYCTTKDGVRIAYCVEGEGPPLVWVPTLLDSFASEYLWPAREQFMSSLGIGRSLVRFDTRGLGLSQREVEGDLSYRTLARDLDAVLSAARLESVTLMTGGPGALLAIWYAVSRPQRVRNLILSTPSVSIAEDAAAGSAMESVADLARTNWSMACHALADALVDRPQRDASLSLADWWMESVTGEIFAREVYDNLDADLSGELANVKAPTLLIYRAETGKHAVDLARRIALAIPNCILAPVAGKHLLVELDETGEILRLVDKFIPPAVHAPISKSRATFRTVLFTDLVGHTEMMSRLGDDRGRDVLREHERITREVLKANGGTEVKTMGDGFMASFGSVTKAVECAVALQRAFADREGEPLSVRVGLNAGEPIEEDGDLFGATVILASRIAAKAEGGEILVADTVRGLCSGKGFLFADRGEFVAKGFEEPLRVSEVNWRNSGAINHAQSTVVEPEQAPVMRLGSNRGTRPLSPEDTQALKLEVRSDPAFVPRMPAGGDHYWVVSGLRITNREEKPVILHFTLHIPWPGGGPGIPSEPMESCSHSIHPLEADRAEHWSHSVKIDAQESASGHLDFFFAKSFVDSLKADPIIYHDAFAVPKDKFLEIRDDISGHACAHEFV